MDKLRLFSNFRAKEKVITKMETPEILELIAERLHSTYLRQRYESKGIPVESGPKEVTADDRDRSKNLWEFLQEHKNLTREHAMRLVAESSRQMYIKHRTRDLEKQGKPPETFDPTPVPHDDERAQDIVELLENRGILHFLK